MKRSTNLLTHAAACINSTEELALLRNLISTIYMHPNVLAHEDFLELRNFFEILGITLSCDTDEICIPTEPSGDTCMTSIHPELPSTSVPFIFSFGFISRMTLDPVKRCAIIQKYTLMPSMKLVLSRLLHRLRESPKFLYLHSYSFVYQFFINFGADPGAISQYVESRRPLLCQSSVLPKSKPKRERKRKRVSDNF